MEKLLTRRNTILFVTALTLWRSYLAATLQLHPDEAYYWLWSRHLAAGYFDHAPLVAYFIKLTTLFSGSELGVRFSGILTSVVISAVAWILSMQLFREEKAAAGSVILLNVYPLTLTGSIIITPDIPSFFFWALGIYVFWQIVRTGKAGYWYLFGVMFGLALLSKYTAVLLAPAVLLFMLLTDERRWFRTPYPYLSMLIAAVVFLPVVYWNFTHQWISFRFQLGHGLGGQSYSLGRVAEYLGGQLLVAGPFAWVLGMAAAVACLFSRSREKLFLSLTSLPIIVFFAYTSLKQVAGPNWPAFAYFTLAIATGGFFLTKASGVKKALFLLAVLVSFSMSLLAMMHARFDVLPLKKYSAEWAKADATNWFYGWRELGEAITRNPRVRVVMTQSHQLSAQVAYYTREKVITTIDPKITRPSQFNLWPLPPELAGSDGLYLYVEGDDPGPVNDYFPERIDTVHMTVLRNGSPVRRYTLIPGSRFQPPALDLPL
ncbi:MAG: glycosyltransferase family 39 protein [Endomicrobiales bacterium]